VPGPVVPIVLGLFATLIAPRGAGGIHRHSGISKDAPFCSTSSMGQHRCRTDVGIRRRITEEWSRHVGTVNEGPDAPRQAVISNVARPKRK